MAKGCLGIFWKLLGGQTVSGRCPDSDKVSGRYSGIVQVSGDCKVSKCPEVILMSAQCLGDVWTVLWFLDSVWNISCKENNIIM